MTVGWVAIGTVLAAAALPAGGRAAGPAAGGAAAGGAAIALPSGAAAVWQETLHDNAGGEGLTYRFRFVIPDLARRLPPAPDAPPEAPPETEADRGPIDIDTETGEITGAGAEAALDEATAGAMDEVTDGAMAMDAAGAGGGVADGAGGTAEGTAALPAAGPDSAASTGAADPLAEGAEGMGPDEGGATLAGLDPEGEADAGPDGDLTAPAPDAAPDAAPAPAAEAASEAASDPAAGNDDPVHRDVVWLCENWALPRIPRPGPRPARIIISLADRPTPFGSYDPDVTQIFESFRLPANRDACEWEPW